MSWVYWGIVAGLLAMLVMLFVSLVIAYPNSSSSMSEGGRKSSGPDGGAGSGKQAA